jgi:hypothetical protein
MGFTGARRALLNRKRPAAAATTTTWDPVNIGSGITLSGGNLIASLGSSPSGSMVRSLASHTTGKYYFEVTINSTPDVNDTSVGLANASAPFSFPGVDSNGMGFNGQGQLVINSAVSSTVTVTYAAGDTVGIAVDMGSNLIWFRNLIAPTTWNNGGTANPATGVGGVSYSVNPGPYFASTGLIQFGGGAQSTGNLGATAYVASAPSGFGNL